MFQSTLFKSGQAWVVWLAFLISIFVLMTLSPLKWTSSEGLPITLQSMLVILIPAVLGWKLGLMAVLTYLIAGGLGLPVFAYGTSGWERFTGSTGGFLMAFPIAAMLVGWAAERVSKGHGLFGILLLFAGQLLILALGLLWQRSIVPIPETVLATLQRFLPLLLVKTAIGSLFIAILGRILVYLTPKHLSHDSLSE